MQRIITKEDLSNKIQELCKEFEVIGPKEWPNKGIFYQMISDAKDLSLGGRFATEPIKKFFLESSSCLFRYEHDDKLNIENVAQSDRKRIIIASRPCEARGLELLDKIFDAEFKDAFYIQNRRKTMIMGLACDEPDETCFCTSMGGSPVETRGMDVLLFTNGEKYILEVITAKGKDVFGSIGKELDAESQKSWRKDKEKRIAALEKKISVPGNMDDIFKNDYWQGVSRSCLSCGICTFLCPTCHCFDLMDEKRKKLRCYDGCAFPDFTLETSGENPRPTKKERYRQRVFHKFDYFKKNFGENLCVGCGRCIRHCPVKIDIADIVDKAPVSENTGHRTEDR